MITKSEIRSGAYFDSVVLMQLQRNLSELEGVDDAGVVMATPANLELLADADLLTKDGKAAKPDDLLIVVRAKKELDAENAMNSVDKLLKRRSSTIAHEFRPHSLQAAAKQLPEAKWVLISVPGRYAAGVARDSLALGKHVFLYSDNVSLEDELSLKEEAQEKGLMVMGPDCGTAIINGVGLGFANRVRKGAIGIVGASGTGVQAISVHIHNIGQGVSHAIGTGGRDLKTIIGAITALQGLRLLAEDDETKVIVLVSKPPSAEVAALLLSAARSCGKPVVVSLIGYPPPARMQGNITFASSLNEAAELAAQLLAQKSIYQPPTPSAKKGYLRGLFSGGTLAFEAMLGLQSVLTPLYSNVPINPNQKIKDPLTSQAHTIVDLGEDIFTVGRLHPMMDNDLRIRRMRQEAEDPETSLILLDAVLGEGSHSDPASELAPVISNISDKRSDIDFAILIIGTDEDPQDIGDQIKQFQNVGAKVFQDSNDLFEHVNSQFSRTTEPDGKPVLLEDITSPLAAINIGLESFFHSLVAQDAQAVHVEWRPPAGGDDNLMDILAKMRN